eukprot:SAG22_NODE_754_length_7443_cov_4.952478_3_plen_116_part_00
MAGHGQANGVFGANECLADRDPSKGTETCVVVEMMESMAQMWTASGDLCYLDQLEEIALNALPAPFFNGSMGAMKYFQETNHFISDRYSQVGFEYNIMQASTALQLQSDLTAQWA